MTWDEVKDVMGDASPIELGSTVAYWFHNTPRRALYAVAFAERAAAL